MTRLYDTSRKTQVAVKPTVSFLQDLNLLMSAYRIDASEVIRGSVSAQAAYIRLSMEERLKRETVQTLDEMSETEETA
jgi:hypothetical protein